MFNAGWIGYSALKQEFITNLTEIRYFKVNTESKINNFRPAAIPSQNFSIIEKIKTGAFGGSPAYTDAFYGLQLWVWVFLHNAATNLTPCTRRSLQDPKFKFRPGAPGYEAMVGAYLGHAIGLMSASILNGVFGVDGKGRAQVADRLAEDLKEKAM